MQESKGNVLVFMSTVGGVNELVQALQLALAHDPGCNVLPLYAPLNDAETARVTSFGDLSMFPTNRGKRLICVATSIAEAGVTIPGKHHIALSPCDDVSAVTACVLYQQVVICSNG